ncbi:uncharacterized protein TRUGW13939_06131 [Talaromyces rugulosus]|uniref:Signal recognition particle receptor subunit beta n=1 Tax=Talaromyces rugulosus TaxID=121627 RepID=A0A7H8QY45_TALRU|nr:uncharacterized protein TRUGW13939_06131 [Talaromyces rugulosus]QKX59002.1 hypothetical protein TRUGW13939_06131 [Talaromyces rugulosus]
MSSKANWSSPSGIATTLLDGNPISILITVTLTLLLPVLLHLFLYRKAVNPPSSTFLLLGPSGSGKTAFLTLLESASSRRSNTAPRTHTSQNATSTTVTLPPSVPIASNQYRSVNDPSLSETKRNPVKYIVKDTPGHGKLRSSQLSQLEAILSSKKEKSPISGVIFFVDAASLSDAAEGLRDCATYLHDVLLLLQKLVFSNQKHVSQAASSVSVLVAANKQDLFTALPAGSIKERLEHEIERIRKSRQKGLMDASAGAASNEDEYEVLGTNGEEDFSFQLLEDEVGTQVSVVGGAVVSEEDTEAGAAIRGWEEWIGARL